MRLVQQYRWLIIFQNATNLWEKCDEAVADVKLTQELQYLGSQVSSSSTHLSAPHYA